MTNFFQNLLTASLGLNWDCNDKGEGEWKSMPSMKSRRHGCSAAILNGHTLVVMGGHDGKSETNTVEIFKLDHNGVWKPSTAGASMKTRRLGCVAATLRSFESQPFAPVDQSECIVVFGGHDGSVLKSAERYHPRLDRWTESPSLPMDGRFDAAAVGIRHRLYVLGGHDGRQPSNQINIFNTISCSWSTAPPMVVNRSHCGAAVLLGRYICVVGGDNGKQALNSVEMYDTESKAWTALPPMMSRRKGCVAAGFGGCLYVFGGTDGKQVLNSCEQFNIATQSWSLLPPMKCRRFGSAIATFKNRICIVGGFDGNSMLNSMEEFTVSACESGESIYMEEVSRQADKHQMEVPPSLYTETTLEYPIELQCPITGELMGDPVVAEDGQSYEREAIEEWFRRFPSYEKPRSPTTNAPVERTLFPNQNLKSLCRQHHEKKNES